MLKRKRTDSEDTTGTMEVFLKEATPEYISSSENSFLSNSVSPVKQIKLEEQINPDFYDKKEFQDLMDQCQEDHPAQKFMLFAFCSNPTVRSSTSTLKLKKRAFWLDWLGVAQEGLLEEQKHSLFIELDGDVYKSEAISEASLTKLSAKFYDPVLARNNSGKYCYLSVYEYIGDKKNATDPVLKIRFSIDSKVVELCKLNKGKLSGTKILQEIFEYFMAYFKPSIIVLNDDARIGSIQLRVLLRIMGRKSFYEEKAGFDIVDDAEIEGYEEPGVFVRQNKEEINKASMFLQEFSLGQLIKEIHVRVKSKKDKGVLERLKDTYIISSDKLKDFVSNIYDACRVNKKSTDLKDFWRILAPELIYNKQIVQENEFYSNMAVLFNQTSILARENKSHEDCVTCVPAAKQVIS